MNLEYVTVGLFALLAAMSPGPDFVLVTKQSVMGSRKIGIYTATGIALGLGIHCLYALIGFSTVIQESKTIYAFIKYLGAAYLSYLGIQLLRSLKEQPLKIDALNSLPKKEISLTGALSSGFLCNVLNPKASLFILSFFSQVVGFTTPLHTQTFMAIEVVAVTLAWFILLTVILTHEKIHKKFLKAQKPIGFIMGLFLLGFSIKLAFL